jgi:hypothetical protein
MRGLSLPLMLAATAVTALVVAGCGTSEPGSPSARTSTTGAEPTSATDAPSRRPRDIDLAGVDPCRTLTQDQTAAWGIDSAPRSAPMGGSSVLAGSPACSLDSGAMQSGVLVVTSTSVGLADYLGAGGRGDARQTSIDGFPAAVREGPTSAPERGSGECYAMVDVSDGQLLLVQFSQIAAAQDRRLPIETLCAKAEEVAEAALTTLQGG